DDALGSSVMGLPFFLPAGDGGKGGFPLGAVSWLSMGKMGGGFMEVRRRAAGICFLQCSSWPVPSGGGHYAVVSTQVSPIQTSAGGGCAMFPLLNKSIIAKKYFKKIVQPRILFLTRFVTRNESQGRGLFKRSHNSRRMAVTPCSVCSLLYLGSL